MADVVINIPVTEVSYRTWLRTSYIASGIISADGLPMVEAVEFGPDQEDVLRDLLEEATREVSKIFVTRQGDVTGIPFEYDGTNVIYRFNEATPVLKQADVVKSQINEDVKNAIYVMVTYAWFMLKGNDGFANMLMNRWNRLSSDIQNSLYRLHD